MSNKPNELNFISKKKSDKAKQKTEELKREKEKQRKCWTFI